MIVVLNLLSLPVYNVISRHMERRPTGWRSRRRATPTRRRALFRNFTIESLNDPDPPTWSYLLFDSHPTVEQRIAMAEAWRGAV